MSFIASESGLREDMQFVPATISTNLKPASSIYPRSSLLSDPAVPQRGGLDPSLLVVTCISNTTGLVVMSVDCCSLTVSSCVPDFRRHISSMPLHVSNNSPSWSQKQR